MDDPEELSAGARGAGRPWACVYAVPRACIDEFSSCGLLRTWLHFPRPPGDGILKEVRVALLQNSDAVCKRALCTNGRTMFPNPAGGGACFALRNNRVLPKRRASPVAKWALCLDILKRRLDLMHNAGYCPEQSPEAMTNPCPFNFAQRGSTCSASAVIVSSPSCSLRGRF